MVTPTVKGFREKEIIGDLNGFVLPQNILAIFVRNLLYF